MQISELKIRFSVAYGEGIWGIFATLSTLRSSCKVKVWLVPGVKTQEAKVWLKDMLEGFDGIDAFEEYEKGAAIWNQSGRPVVGYGVGAAEI